MVGADYSCELLVVRCWLFVVSAVNSRGVSLHVILRVAQDLKIRRPSPVASVVVAEILRRLRDAG
jgi:hypothetical protein